MEPIIRVDHLTHTYSAGTPFQRSAVKDMSLDILPGEFLGVIGHTGSGKSTLIQHLNGLLKPTDGHIYLNGQDIWADPKQIRQVRFHVGLVFQYPEYQLFEETVYKDVAFGPKNMGLDDGEIDRRVRQSVQAVGLSADVLEKSPFALSGGQKRRVAIAGVMAMEPEVLILDEPTAGLDPRGCAATTPSAAAPWCWSATAWRRSPATPSASLCWTRASSACRARQRRCSPGPVSWKLWALTCPR